MSCVGHRVGRTSYNAGLRSSGYSAGAARRVELALQTFQIAAKIGGRLVAQFAILFERFADDVLEFGREIGIESHRRDGNAVHNRFENHGGAFAAEGKLTGGHFVENDAERKKVAAWIELFSADLLGRHIGNGADGAARTGEMFGIDT